MQGPGTRPRPANRLPLRILCEAVSNAKFGDKNARLGGILFDLMAQLANKNAQIMGIMRVASAPNFLQELRVRNDIAGVLCQDLQQPIFLRRQLHSPAVDGNRPRRKVDKEWPCLHDVLATCTA